MPYRANFLPTARQLIAHILVKEQATKTVQKITLLPYRLHRSGNPYNWAAPNIAWCVLKAVICWPVKVRSW
jgi:hypothetical protein